MRGAKFEGIEGGGWDRSGFFVLLWNSVRARGVQVRREKKISTLNDTDVRILT